MLVLLLTTLFFCQENAYAAPTPRPLTLECSVPADQLFKELITGGNKITEILEKGTFTVPYLDNAGVPLYYVVVSYGESGQFYLALVEAPSDSVSDLTLLFDGFSPDADGSLEFPQNSCDAENAEGVRKCSIRGYSFEYLNSSNGATCDLGDLQELIDPAIAELKAKTPDIIDTFESSNNPEDPSPESDDEPENAGQKDENSGLSQGQIIGISVGVVAVVGIVGAIVWRFIRERKQRYKEALEAEQPYDPDDNDTSSQTASQRLSSPVSSTSSNKQHDPNSGSTTLEGSSGSASPPPSKEHTK